MAATLMQQYNLALDTRLRSVVAAALNRVADNVRIEPSNTPYSFTPPLGSPMNATRSQQRQQLVLIVKGGGIQGVIDAFARACADNATIQGEVTFSGDNVTSTTAVVDSDVIFVCAQAWDLVAGVLPANIP